MNYDVVMPLKTAQASITVTADAGAIVDTSTAGITQLLNSTSIENLPFPAATIATWRSSLPPCKSSPACAAVCAWADSRATTAAW